MSQESTKVIAMATVLVIAVSSAILIYISSIPNDSDFSNTLGIASLQICGNSTDILYPELMDASIVFQDGSWMISASFVDDSEGWDHPELYDREFSVTPEEVENISLSLHEGLNHTYPSEISSLELLESSLNMGFEIEITYSDGSWVYAITFQVGEGYIMFNSGTGTPERGLESCAVLEPVSALDGLVGTIYAVFSNHLN